MRLRDRLERDFPPDEVRRALRLADPEPVVLPPRQRLLVTALECARPGEDLLRACERVLTEELLRIKMDVATDAAKAMRCTYRQFAYRMDKHGIQSRSPWSRAARARRRA